MESKNTFLNLLKVVRLHIVLGGALAFTLGMLLGLADGGSFNLSAAALFYAIVFFGDLSTHYSNDYFDANQDRTAKFFKFFSGRRILAKHPKLQPLARRIAIVLLSTSILLAILAFAFRFAPIELLLIVVAANFLGWFYSAPPLRLVSRGLGETSIALAAGLAIPAMGYLAVKGQLYGLFWLFALPFMLYGFILALSLEAPDIEADQKNGRRNFGVRKGEGAVFALIFAVALAAFLWLVGSLLIGSIQFDLWLVAAFASMPLVAALVGFAGVVLKKNARVNTFSAVEIFSLFAFNLMLIGYLVLL